MTVNVGVMELPVTEDPDPIRTYLNGTHASGGLWTALTRSSNHDHSGGLNGVQLGATSIPDGSITAAKLDPAVLLPYALVDGSKPFTGQVTMQADAIVRDALYFGQQGSALPADATLARTGPGALRADTHLGVGVPAPVWPAPYAAVSAGQTALYGHPTSTGGVRSNSRYDGAVNRAIIAGAGLDVSFGGGEFAVYTAPAVAADAPQTMTQRLQLAPTGTLTLTPAAGVAPLQANAGSAGLSVSQGVAANVRLTSTGASGSMEISGVHLVPWVDNFMSLGGPTNRWNTMYAAVGAINTSSREYKEGITPLDPAACYQAAKDVRWYDFRYAPPAYTEPEPPPDIAYDASDDNETKAEKKARRDEAEAQAKAAHAKMLVETAPARHQRGFVFPDGAEAKDEAGGALPPVPDLFGLSDRESTTPQADLATLGCALQEVIRRLEAVEAAPAR